MWQSIFQGTLCGLILLAMGLLQPAEAQLTAQHRRELQNIGREVTKVAQLVRKKEYEEAKTELDQLQQQVEEIAKAAEVELTDRAIMPIMAAITRQRELVDKALGTGSAAPVSFTKEIAPLINERCLNCHGANNPRRGLRLDTFAGWKRGGMGGPLLVPGSANTSLIVGRVSAPEGQGRMPPNGDACTAAEITKLSSWINQGAKFDGGDENKLLADVIFEFELKNNNVKLPKPTGKETVSFTRDIAPWFSNLCLGCHNEQRKSGGLSVATFFDIMKGGESGEVIIPGDMENSRLFRLVGGLENPRMPQGQARITRKNYEDLRTWFREGNTFDGADPRTRITAYVRTDDDLARERFNRMTAEEFLTYRSSRSRDQFKRALPNDTPEILESEQFLLLGNVPAPRLKQVQGWAEEELQALQKMFNDSSPLPWRGKLAIFVVKDRFSYEEFSETIERRRPALEMQGHSTVTANQEDAYLVLQDLGDEATADQPNLQISLIDHLGGAYVKRGGGTPPAWLVRGLGLSLAAGKFPQQPYFRKLEQSARGLAPTVGTPAEVFRDGSFSPGSVGGVGYSLTAFLLKSAPPAKFGQLIQGIADGQTVEAALQNVYGLPADELARAYFASLK